MSRRIYDIPGGIHPAENKSQSLKNPIKNAGIPAQIVLPLSQHIGAPAKPIVTVGERVLKGQVIAEANGFVSVPVHASTSGTVIAIETRPITHFSGLEAPCIIIDTDGADEWVEHQGVDDYRQLDKQQLLNLIRNAGIAGMGGAGFPSSIKLAGHPDKPIATLIINATECEPYITADDMLIRERAEQVVAGVQILQHLVSPTSETLIGIEDNKPEAIEILRQACQNTTIEVVSLPTKYPSGGEKQLIQILTGKEVPSGKLPADIGVVLQNIGTATAIYRAVTHGEPLIERITTVTGEAIETPQNYQVLLGTPANYLLEKCAFDIRQASQLIIGGPMMGIAVNNTDVPVVKTTNCILAPTAAEIAPPTPAQACIRCGTCANACPAGLLPQQLYWFSRAKENEKLEEHNLADCIECGCCTYVCPSNIPLVQYYRASKAAIRTAKAEADKSEHAKQRFEAREARIEQVNAEKEAKRAARAAAAKEAAAKKAAAAQSAEATPSSDGKADVIAAALARTAAKKATTTGDPVQDAIERAKAKRAGGASEESAEDKLAKLEKRLDNAKNKLAAAIEAGNDNIDAFKTGVEKSQAKVDEARAAVAAEQKAAPVEDNSVDLSDPVAAAIAKAQNKRAGGASEESAEDKLAKLEKRLENANNKLAAAIEAGNDNIDAFKTGVEKSQAKVDEARAAVAAEQKAAPVEDNSVDLSDPVAAAIAKAQAKRAGGATAESIDDKVAKLETRLAKAQQKLAAAEAEGNDNIDAFKTGVEKSQEKLDAAKLEQAKTRPASEAPTAPKAAADDDPVAAAIAKAQAKRAGASVAETPEQQVAKLRKRLTMAEDKLRAAEAEGSDKLEAFQAGVDKLQSKLREAEAALAESE
ncbi:Ion-translocating oxidoreductase complex subunit C [Sinobacterium norvegicum]|uniref:Ion-translocating oxidoreductase complex subunit C n=1 Tax=Sinobacterium norvegicum TaxID=1641715 RepID=A0ABN8EJN8_9GAMM|nr:electron transport complex subunit RsxC [Sinobacterium norvegicum]CAH0992299.1 Ion-translocating oxidoreductase complex subunit C [Sinobacterium norvegicum]